MKASYNWLKSLVPGLDDSPAGVAERLTRGGLEVEAITEYGAATREVIVAEVLAIEPHPSREKLRLVTVNRGSGAPQRVVCGAPNVPAKGGRVVLAPLGARLPMGGEIITLGPREIGGVVSEGMLCSERELGLASADKPTAVDPHDPHAGDPGILILPSDAGAPGTPLDEAVPAAHDFIYEIGVTPNRPDALGHVGLARELAALYALPWSAPSASPVAPPGAAKVSDVVRVCVEDTERCPHYAAGAVVELTVGPSPAWLRYRLESLGIRSISNIVDVTNWMLLEHGHPMHAFDLDQVRGGAIIVRRAQPGERLVTLDGVDRALDPDDLVIADGHGPVALAGVMGGAGSEIGPSTKRVLLECAYFWPRGVRRSARRHGLHSESSHRFERGVDPGDIDRVLCHASRALVELGGGAALASPIVAGVPLQTPAPLTLRQSRMDALLGVTIPLRRASEILSRLGFAVVPAEAGALEVTPPTHRPDIVGEADLIEEVLRVEGLDAIPARLPAIAPQAPRVAGIMRGRARRAAIDLGLAEAMLYGFIAPRDLVALGLPPSAVTLVNPLTEERSVMRTSLLPGLLEAVRRARRRGERDVRLFATGARFLASIDANDPLPDEVPSFAAVLAGDRPARLAKPEKVDVYDAKGLAVELCHRITGRAASVRHQPAAERAPYLHPRAAADVLIDGEVVGRFGVLHPSVDENLDLDGECVLVELDLRALERIGVRVPAFRPIPSLPATTRDVALVVHDDVTAGEVAEAIHEAASELCESVELFDLFEGASLPSDHRSLAYHVVYRDPAASTNPQSARTLTDAEVDKAHTAMLAAIKARYGAVQRA